MKNSGIGALSILCFVVKNDFRQKIHLRLFSENQDAVFYRLLSILCFAVKNDFLAQGFTFDDNSLRDKFFTPQSVCACSAKLFRERFWIERLARIFSCRFCASNPCCCQLGLFRKILNFRWSSKIENFAWTYRFRALSCIFPALPGAARCALASCPWKGHDS